MATLAIIGVHRIPQHSEDTAKRSGGTTSSEQDRLQRMQQVAEFVQADGVQIRSWQQKHCWEFKSETEAIAHGFHTLRAARQASKLVRTGGNPATETCKAGQCLQSAVQKGEAWSPKFPDTVGVEMMNQVADSLRDRPDAVHNLASGKDLPWQFADAADLQQDIKTGASGDSLRPSFVVAPFSGRRVLLAPPLPRRSSSLHGHGKLAQW